MASVISTLMRDASHIFVNVRQGGDLFVSVLPTNMQKGISIESSRGASIQQCAVLIVTTSKYKNGSSIDSST